MKKSKTRKKLIKSCELRADVSVRGAATQRNDQQMLSITANELHASEALYHQSCYRNYTRVPYKMPNICEDANPVKAKMPNIYEDPREMYFRKAKDYVYQKFKERQTVGLSSGNA